MFFLKKSTINNAGFSIFELIVAIAVIGLLSLFVIQPSSQARNDAQMDQAVNQMVEDIKNIRTATQIALAIPTSSGNTCDSSTGPCQYPNIDSSSDVESYILFNLNQDTYDIRYRGSDTGGLELPNGMTPKIITNVNRDQTSCIKSLDFGPTTCPSPTNSSQINFHPPGVFEGFNYPSGYAILDTGSTNDPEKIHIDFEFKGRWRRITIDRFINVTSERISAP